MTGRGPDTPSGADIAVRAAMLCAVAAVAGVAAWTSYLHTVAVVTEHGEDQATAQLVPVTTDGLILAAGLVLLHSARSGRPAPALARWLLGLGIAATLAANVLHGVGHGPVGAVVAAWPATAFVGVSELALWLIRASARPVPVDAPTAVSAPYEASRARERRAKVLAEDAARRAAEGRERGRAVQRGESVSPKLGETNPKTRETAKLGAIGTGYSGSTLDKVDRIRDVAERGVVRQGKTETPAAAVGRSATVTAATGSDTAGGWPVTSSASRPRSATGSDSGTGQSDTASTTALASVRSWLADDPGMSGAAIGRRLGVSARTGQRLRAAALGQ